MQLFVLAGLVTVEKAQLTADLAQQFTARDISVRVFDQMARLPLSAQNIDTIPDVIVERLTQLHDLQRRIATAHENTFILSASEQLHPDELFLAVDDLATAMPDLTITTFALIDLRTCDCFPHVRHALEAIADHTFLLPVTVEDVLTHAGIA